MNDEKFNPKEKERREEGSIVRLSRRDRDLLCHVASETRSQSISQVTALNELYVALAEAAAKVRKAPSQIPFRWIAGDATGLPWRECNRETGVFEERRLVPDATLELAGERTRVFLERDGGGGSDEHAVASALVKLRRYSAFVMEGGDRTYYAEKYPDRWKAELVFLFHFRARASDVSRAIEAWQEKNRDVRLAARSFCIDGAVTHFASRLGLPRPIESGVPLDAADVRLICRWVPEVLTTYKAVRHYLRANPAVRAQGCPYPEYAPEFERMMAFAERLRSELRAIGGRGRRSSSAA